MAIRFELPEQQEGVVAFGYSPLLETVLSLHVLAVPKHHALQHGWVRAMRALPASLRREITTLSFLYRHTLPDFLLAPRSSPSTFSAGSTTTEGERARRGDASWRPQKCARSR